MVSRTCFIFIPYNESLGGEVRPAPRGCLIPQGGLRGQALEPGPVVPGPVLVLAQGAQVEGQRRRVAFGKRPLLHVEF